MCLAQGPQRSDAGEARTLGLESSTLLLSHCAPKLYLLLDQETFHVMGKKIYNLNSEVFTLLWERVRSSPRLVTPEVAY